MATLRDITLTPQRSPAPAADGPAPPHEQITGKSGIPADALMVARAAAGRVSPGR
jgi:hypothetical protein